MNSKQFKKLMQTVSEEWNEGNTKKASECFADDAIYIEPPDKQFFQGRDQLFVYFGGDSGRKNQMKMKWHNLVFDEHTQVGMGEYTFEMSNMNHGVAVVKIKNGKIKTWREYLWTGKLNYKDFISYQDKKFEFTVKDLK